jgi:Uma2 family endonuclease
MSPLRKHEWVVSLLKRFVEILTFELGIKIASAGSTTLKSQFKDRGVEPDGSYYVQNEPHIRFKDDFDITVDPPPDLAIEVDITSSSVDKFGVYAAFEVPELWTYDHEAVRMFVLQPTGGYVEVARSLAFPQLTSEVLNRFLRRRKVVDETTLVHEFCAWVRNTSAQGAGTAG